MPRTTDRTSDTTPDKFLSGPQVCARYGIVQMSLWRWLNDAEYADVRFPPPTFRVRDRRFWREQDLIEWERRRAAHSLRRKPIPRNKEQRRT
jgi:predicted DNA-binding transcriptional regulator AlpA